MSPLLKDVLLDTEDPSHILILSDFDLKDIQAVLHFVTSGYLDRDYSHEVFEAFGIDVQKLNLTKELMEDGRLITHCLNQSMTVKKEEWDDLAEDCDLVRESLDTTEDFMDASIDDEDFGNIGKVTKQPKKATKSNKSRNSRNGLRPKAKPEVEDVPTQCPFCDIQLESYLKMRRHVLDEHREEDRKEKAKRPKVPCQLCPRQFRFPGQLTNHMKRFHDPNKADRYQCVQCGKSSDNPDLIERANYVKMHSKQMGPFHRNKCAQCPAVFNSYAEHMAHINTEHNGIYKYVCGYCDALFDTEEDRREHRKAQCQAGSDTIMCDICGDTINKSSKRQHFESKHAENKDLACDQCPRRYKTAFLLSRHVKKSHGAKFPCDICGKFFVTMVCLKQHKIRHLPNSEKPFICQVCGFGTVTNDHLRTHMEIHADERNYKCRFCSSAFKQAATRNGHELQVHLGQKRIHKPKNIY